MFLYFILDIQLNFLIPMISSPLSGISLDIIIGDAVIKKTLFS